ncbi:a-type inclusion protein [Anaeramoeba ignava]|uniref:A-type inclusion protein n=1 Tax=Anaeramoeba ignava TaxID=1746090 RepID=A0A9Q0R8F8_ANAIG|nr:a-type inclusion protein [Anaeramoeba ignava]
MGNANNAKHKVTKSTLKKYKKKIYSSKDAVVVVNAEKGFIEANDAAVKLYEASGREELLRYKPQDLSPPIQEHLGKSSLDALLEGIQKAWESEDGYYDLVVNIITLKGRSIFIRGWITPLNFLGQTAIQGIVKRVPKPNSTEQKIESTTDVDSSLLKPKFDDESSDTLFDSQSETNKSEKQNSNSEKQHSNTEKQPPNLSKQTSNGVWTKDNLDKEIQRLDKELEKGMKEKARLERIKFKVLEKQLNEKIQENTQLKNEIFVLQQLLEEMKKSNNENESESQLQEEIERIKEKKKKYKTEVERLTNRLKMVEFEKENLKKLM